MFHFPESRLSPQRHLRAQRLEEKMQADYMTMLCWPEIAFLIEEERWRVLDMVR